jgi:hypothetical protein
MSNLLSIETAFLNRAEIKTALQLTEVRSLQRTLSNGQKKKFDSTLQLSKIVLSAATWFSSDEGKAKCSEEGITWTMEDFAQKVFGWKNSYFCKVRKAGALQPETIETFKAKCEEVEQAGQEPNRTLEGLLKFAKQVETGSTAGGTEEGSEEGSEDSTEAQVEVRTETIFTLTYKTEAGNVSVRIDAAGVVKTTNSITEIEKAILFLMSQLPQ